MQILQSKYQDDFSAAIEAGDNERAEELQSEFQEESDKMLDDMGITSEDLSEFELHNPGFLEDPEVQQRIMQRVQELSEE